VPAALVYRAEHKPGSSATIAATKPRRKPGRVRGRTRLSARRCQPRRGHPRRDRGGEELVQDRRVHQPEAGHGDDGHHDLLRCSVTETVGSVDRPRLSSYRMAIRVACQIVSGWSCGQDRLAGGGAVIKTLALCGSYGYPALCTAGLPVCLCIDAPRRTSESAADRASGPRGLAVTPVTFTTRSRAAAASVRTA
jgi:hypothetical protein